MKVFQFARAHARTSPLFQRAPIVEVTHTHVRQTPGRAGNFVGAPNAPGAGTGSVACAMHSSAAAAADPAAHGSGSSTAAVGHTTGLSRNVCVYI